MSFRGADDHAGVLMPTATMMRVVLIMIMLMMTAIIIMIMLMMTMNIRM